MEDKRGRKGWVIRRLSRKVSSRQTASTAAKSGRICKYMGYRIRAEALAGTRETNVQSENALVFLVSR